MSAPRQIIELQSLRGLAALLVAVCHMLSVYDLPDRARLTLDTLFNAHAAVILFFVLSGYVLTASLARKPIDLASIVQYYARRAFRIFPAVWVACVLAAVVVATLGDARVAPVASEWFLTSTAAPLSLMSVVLSLMAVGTDLIPPMGTILTELVGSFFLPWFALLVLRWRAAIYLLLPVLMVLAVATADAPFRLNAFSYLINFGLGMAVFLGADRLQGVLNRWAGIAAVASALVLILFRTLWFLATTGGWQPLTYDYHATVPALVEGLSSAVLIASVVAREGRLRLLKAPMAITLGEISYSLYLVHFPIMSALAWGLAPVFVRWETGPYAATAMVLGAGLILSVALATLLYRRVERPGMNLGRRLAPLVWPPRRGAVDA